MSKIYELTETQLRAVIFAALNISQLVGYDNMAEEETDPLVDKIVSLCEKADIVRFRDLEK